LIVAGEEFPPWQPEWPTAARLMSAAPYLLWRVSLPLQVMMRSSIFNGMTGGYVLLGITSCPLFRKFGNLPLLPIYWRRYYSQYGNVMVAVSCALIVSFT